MTWTQVALMRQRMTVKTTNKDFLIFLYQKFTGVVALSKNTQWKLMHTPKKKGYITTALTQMHRFYMNCSAPQSKLENIHTFSSWLTVFKILQWAPAYGCQTRTHLSTHNTRFKHSNKDPGWFSVTQWSAALWNLKKELTMLSYEDNLICNHTKLI